MAGLYIHIPFCKSRCIYCGFYSTTHLDLRQRYVDALCREMELRRHKGDGSICVMGMTQREPSPIGTIYLGGGTPSQLSIEQLRQLFLYINKVYPLTSNTEITIEMNPDDVTFAYAEALQQIGINRVSMGAQTFDDERLRFLHRRHTAAQVAQAVKILREAGIQNISVDLMYGFPHETLDDWQRDIDAALVLNVEHLSAYCLMIEEGTVLYEKMRNEKMRNEEMTQMEPFPLCDEELERAMYEMLMDKLTAVGYEHYEISNFARPGFRSRHNSSYWHDVPYIGLGAAAHSYSIPGGGTAGHSNQSRTAVRSWNVSDIRQYIAAIEKGELPCEREEIDDDTHYNDRITTALRTKDGLDLTTLSDRHRHYCLKEAQRFIDDGLLQLHKGDGSCCVMPMTQKNRPQDALRLSLTRKGLFVSDMVMSSLMLV